MALKRRQSSLPSGSSKQSKNLRAALQKYYSKTVKWVVDILGYYGDQIDSLVRSKYLIFFVRQRQCKILFI